MNRPKTWKCPQLPWTEGNADYKKYYVEENSTLFCVCVCVYSSI